MKITKRQLKQIIKEELSTTLQEITRNIPKSDPEYKYSWTKRIFQELLSRLQRIDTAAAHSIMDEIEELLFTKHPEDIQDLIGEITDNLAQEDLLRGEVPAGLPGHVAHRINANFETIYDIPAADARSIMKSVRKIVKEMEKKEDLEFIVHLMPLALDGRAGDSYRAAWDRYHQRRDWRRED